MIHQLNTMIVARILGIFSGQSIDGAFDTTEIYDPKMDKWSTEEPMPTAHLGLEAIALDDKIYVIGGKTDIGPHVSDINEILNTKIHSTPN